MTAANHYPDPRGKKIWRTPKESLGNLQLKPPPGAVMTNISVSKDVE
jgi:hypothetical protein